MTFQQCCPVPIGQLNPLYRRHNFATLRPVLRRLLTCPVNYPLSFSHLPALGTLANSIRHHAFHNLYDSGQKTRICNAPSQVCSLDYLRESKQTHHHSSRLFSAIPQRPTPQPHNVTSRTAILRCFTSGSYDHANQDKQSPTKSCQNAAVKLNPVRAPEDTVANDKYTYQPLQGTHSFRLMSLLPGCEKEPLRCELQDAELGDDAYYESLPELMPIIAGGENARTSLKVQDTRTGKHTYHESLTLALNSANKPKLKGPPQYEALSYVWGDEIPPAFILCHGKELQLTQNLEEALYQFRLENEPRLLWIDSICINQDDIFERAQQVKIMGKIYRGTFRVLIWLGKEDESTEIAYSFMSSYLMKAYEAASSSGSLKNGELIAVTEFLPSPSFPQYQALEKLFKRPWFTRAWTFQESLLSRSSIIQCGSFSIHGTIFSMCLAGAPKPHTSSHQNAALMFSQHIYKQDFRRCLVEFCAARRNVGAKDPRDLVYSLLGVASDGDNVEPDYSRSVEEVYASLALQYIHARGNLNILGHVQRFLCRANSDFPTWVPDWRIKFTRWYAYTHPWKRVYNATGSAKASPKRYGDWNIRPALSIPGILVEAMGAPRWLTKSEEWPQAIEQMKSRLVQLGGPAVEYEHTNEPLDLAFLRTLFSDMAPVRKGEWQRWTRESFLAALQFDLGYWRDAIEHRGIASRFFFTDKFRIGLSPFGAKGGDLICLLLGGEVPVLLRPYRDGYIFIGECYVHGLMDGEGLVEARRHAQPNDDHSDFSWLQRLHEEPLPFKTEDFIIY